MILHAIYGSSGFGRGVMPLARAQAPASAELVFVDDLNNGFESNGHRVLSYEELLRHEAGDKRVTIAIADSTVRERLVERCIRDGLRFEQVRAGNVIQMDAVEIGEGAVLSPFVTLTSNIRIGRHFQANLYSYVAHDCVIGDFVTFAPGVKCNGNVVIGDHAYIGAGAIIRNGRPGTPMTIGRGAVVGMGAVVTKPVPPGVTVAGNPARPLVRP